jgi:hypothetical protein
MKRTPSVTTTSNAKHIQKVKKKGQEKQVQLNNTVNSIAYKDNSVNLLSNHTTIIERDNSFKLKEVGRVVKD